MMEDSIQCLVCNGSNMDIIWEALCNLGSFYLSFHGSWCTVCCWLLKWLCKTRPWCLLPILETVLTCRCEHRPCVGWQNLGYGAGAQICWGLVLGQPVCPWQEMMVTVSIPHGNALSYLSAELWRQKSLQDTKMLNFYSIKDLKTNSHKKLSLFLPIIGTDKLVLELFSFSLCSNGKIQ